MVDTVRFDSGEKKGPNKVMLACNDARNDLCNRMGGQYSFHRSHFNTHAANYNGAANSAAGAAKLVSGAGCPALNAQAYAHVSWV